MSLPSVCVRLMVARAHKLIASWPIKRSRSIRGGFLRFGLAFIGFLCNYFLQRIVRQNLKRILRRYIFDNIV